MLSHRSWTVESVLRLMIGLFLGLAVAGMLGELTRWLASGLPEGRRQFVTAGTTTLLVHALVFGLIIWFLHVNRLGLTAAFGLGRPRRVGAVLTGVVVMPVVLPCAFALQWTTQQVLQWFAVPAEVQPAIKMLTTAHEPWERLLMGLQTVVTAPIAEELLFRGIFYVSIKQAGYPRLAFWGVSVLFGLCHSNLLTLAPLIFFGFVLTWLYERTDNLLAPITAHFTFNALNFALVMLTQT